jgi:release factor glutamine methyltransferase
MTDPMNPGMPQGKKPALRKKLLNKFWKPLVSFYLKSPRKFKYQGLQLLVMPGVFHPGLFFSSRILADFISGLDLAGKKFLDLGCGSGLVAMVAAKKGAIVTATDISAAAIACTKDNAIVNRLSLETLRTDLFEGLQERHFDVIAVNPPYFRKDPRNEAEHAWYAGLNYEYFSKFFSQLPVSGKETSSVYMILSEDCDLESIFYLARQAGFGLHAVNEYHRAGEMLTLFECFVAGE